MPQAAIRERYEENSQAVPSSAHSILSLIGGAKSFGSGYGAFMTKTIVLSSCASCIFGLAGFMMGSLPCFGMPLLGYMAGAQFGFTGGLLTRWLSDRDAATRAVDEYPALMAHQLRIMEPVSFGNSEIMQWKKDLRVNIAKQGMAVAAYYDCSDSISQLQDAKEAKLVSTLIEVDNDEGS